MLFKEEVLIKKNPEHIFKHYENVKAWKIWDHDIKEASIDGKFNNGTIGTLTPTKGPKAKFTLTEVKHNDSFSSITKLPLCRITFKHELEEYDTHHTKVIHTVSFTGLTRFIFRRLIGSQIQKSLPTTMQGLKTLCEKKS